MSEEKDVLIVDDNEECVIYLTEILEDLGYPYRVARNGKEGLEAIRAKKPDLLFKLARDQVLNPFRCHAWVKGPHDRFANLDGRIFLLRIGQIGKHTRDCHDH